MINKKEIIIIIIILVTLIGLQIYNLIENKGSKYSTYVLYIPERYEYIKKELDKTTLNPIFIEGYDKTKLSKSLIDEQGKTSGKIACHMGHLYILDKFLKSDDDYAFILEDDIYFTDHNIIKGKIDYIINVCPRDSDIIFVSYCLEDCKYIDNMKLFSKGKRPLCRHAYIVSRRCAKIILKETWPMNKFPGPGGDNSYVNLIKNNTIQSYTVNSNFINIEQNRTKLGSKLGDYDSGKAPPKCIN
jgi:GR25 family glycosyltransferase involved in LPS biosynthesis